MFTHDDDEIDIDMHGYTPKPDDDDDRPILTEPIRPAVSREPPLIVQDIRTRPSPPTAVAPAPGRLFGLPPKRPAYLR